MGLPENHAEPPASPYGSFGEAPPERVLEESARQSTTRLTFTARVRRLIEQELHGGNPSKEHIADRMGMSARTLCRRLAADGTSFVEVLNDLRRELAVRYLADQTASMSEVASRLGFSSVSAFGRAFRRWTGLSPTAYGQKAATDPAPRDPTSGPEPASRQDALSASPVGARPQTD